MADKSTMWWEGWRGKKQTREINHTLDIRSLRGTAGYAWAFMAANTHLSAADTERWLSLESREHPGAYRGKSWIKRRRWMFQPPGTVNASGPRRNADAKDHKAAEIMRANPTMSARNLSRLLKENDIDRGKDWVLRNRCR
jgi:hypothetical protein